MVDRDSESADTCESLHAVDEHWAIPDIALNQFTLDGFQPSPRSLENA